jgi:hypothetical protein
MAQNAILKIRNNLKQKNLIWKRRL